MDAPQTPQPPAIVGSNDRIWIVLSHLSALLGVGILLPLIIYLVKKDESPLVGYHSKEALNFHISVYLYVLCCVPLAFVFVGIPMIAIIVISTFIFSIIAAVRSVDGDQYRYPLTIRLVK
jgi:uncharacterized Tic20 family protein